MIKTGIVTPAVWMWARLQGADVEAQDELQLLQVMYFYSLTIQCTWNMRSAMYSILGQI